MRLVEGSAMRVFAAAALAATLATSSPAAQSSSNQLRQLGGIDELKSWFNAGRGRPRLIFLLSPT